MHRKLTVSSSKPLRSLNLESLERRDLFAVGGLDPTFNFGWGKASTDFGGSSDWSSDSAFQTDGKIVVVGGTTAGGGGQNFAVARYNSNGSLDSSFGGFAGIGTGRVVTDFASGQDQAQKVLIQPDGKILVIGWTNPFGDEVGELPGYENEPVQEHRWAIARYNVDGSSDNSFGVLGKAVIHRPGQYDVLGVAGAFFLGDQLLLVSDGPNSTLLSRINLGDGSVDMAFGNAGHVETTTPIVVRAAAIHGDGIVLAGRSQVGTGMALSRILMNGTVDNSFGVNGLTVVGPEYASAELYAVTVQENGSIVGAGENSVVRVLANGTADASFSVDGVVRFEGDLYSFRDVALSANGTIIAAGDSNFGKDFVVVRVGADGAPDANFGVGGMVKIDFGLFDFSNDYATSVLTYANGKILVSGSVGNDFGLARINGAGVLRNPGGPVRLVDVLATLNDRDPRRALLQSGLLLNFVKLVDQVITQHPNSDSDLLAARLERILSDKEVRRSNLGGRANTIKVLDQLFAALGDYSSIQ